MFALLLIASAGISTATIIGETIEKNTFTSGAFIKPWGSRNLAGTTLVVPIKISNPGYASLALQNAEQILQSIEALGPNTRSSARIEALRGSLAHYNNTLNIVKSKAHKPRVRRGLINLGGTVLQHLFGVATEDETNLIAESVRNATTTFTTATKTLRIESAVLHKAVSQLSAAMRDELATSTLILNDVINTLQVNRQLDLIGDLVLMVDSIVDNIQTTRAMLRSGEYVQLINTNDLTDILQHARDTIPKGERFCCEIEKPRQFLKILRIEPTNAATVFALHVPFVQEEVYQMYEIAALPQSDGNQTWFSYRLENRFVGIGQDHFLAEKEIKCNQVFCENILENGLRNTSATSCELEIVANKEAPHCILEPVNPDTTFTLTTLTREWIVSVLTKSKVTISCPDTKTVQHRAAKGNFVVRKTCDFTSQFLSLLGNRQTIQGAIEVKDTLPYQFSETTAEINPEASNLIKMHKMERTLIHLHKNLQKNLSQIEVQQIHLVQRAHIHLGSGIIVTSILIIGLIAAACYFKRKADRQVEAQVQERNVHHIRRHGTL